MRLRRSALYSIVGACLALAAVPARADWATRLPNGDVLKPLQLFLVNTEGEGRRPPWLSEKERPRVPPIKEFGTGFAVAQNVVITARHVTHDADDFVSLVDKVSVPDRTITLYYPEGTAINAEIKPISDLWVTPAAAPITDAVKLTLVEHAVTPFQISMCEISPGAAFHLLKFRQNPVGGSKNLRVPVLIPVTADIDPTERLGELRRFKHETDDPEDRPIPGDSGSPILDANGRVVGLLTAIQGDNLLYVTPVSSFFELIPEDERRKIDCYSTFTLTESVEWSSTGMAKDKWLGVLEDEGFCFLTRVYGAFEQGDFVSVEISKNEDGRREWKITGDDGEFSSSLQHKGVAQCYVER